MVKKLIIIFATLGFIDAAYLLIIKLTSSKALCVPGLGDCWSVNNSTYSEWNGIPISVFGMLAYLSILFLVVYGPKMDFLRHFEHIFALGIGLAGFIFSIYLTYLQIAVIKAICPFCVISAITMTTVFVLVLIRYIAIQNKSEM